jgi:hypothetical protein
MLAEVRLIERAEKVVEKACVTKGKAEVALGFGRL